MKKIMSVFLSLIIFLSSFSSVFAAGSLEGSKKKAKLYSVENGKQLMTWKGMIDSDNFAPKLIVYKEGSKELPAYCIQPNVPGVDQLGGYEVGVDDKITNVKIWGAITNGYPYKTLAELEVNSKYEAYYATKMAVWALVHDNYSNISDWAANGSHNAHVEKAMKKIYNAGLNTNSIPSVSGGSATATPLTATALADDIDENYMSQTFTVSSDGDYSISLGSGAPSGTKITDEQNKAKSDFKKGDKFKVLIPFTGKDSGGSFNVNINAETSGKAILWGKSYNPDKQDYAVVSESMPNKDAIATVSYFERYDTEKKLGKLKIVKVEHGTTKGLAGAVFRVTDADGGIVGDYVTDGNGQVTVILEDLGAYYVDEIVAPAGYQLDLSNHKDIVVTATEEAILTFANKPTNDLEILKVDADTNEKLEGAVIRIAYDGGHKFIDVQTDNSGKAKVTDLADGTYTVTEITAPTGYILDNTPHAIKLEAGKPAQIILKNNEKPGIKIKKYDEDTGLPLEGAEFSISKKGGSIVYEGITGKDGTIKVEELTSEWYTITEIAAPKGYLIATESKDVFLEPNKCTEIKFDNRKRPALQIMKIDSQTNKLLAGAKFKVWKTEDLTVSEYVTDETGTITIIDLDEAIYSVVETKAPDGYLLDPQHKDIKLEWGKTKTLVYTNKARPGLEVLKIDEATKEPLAGAKFKITATESKTTGEYITDKDGKILLKNLTDEIYTVEEIVAPDGYLIEIQHKDIELEWGKIKQLVFTNKARPSLEIRKIDTITEKPLEGARFKVTKTEDLTVSEYVTDKNGVILIKNLDDAIYTVEEIVAPNGYILRPQHKDIELEWGKTKNLIYENTKKPTLIITKTNGLTYEPIPNTTYKIEYENSTGGVVTLGTFRTNTDGKIVIKDVEPGWYSVTETIPAPGFSLPSNPVTREYLAPGENAYTIFNDSEKGGDISGDNIKITYGSEYILGHEIINYPLNSIVIRKAHFVTGEMLPGAVFELRKVTEDVSGGSGTIIGRYTTDNSGVIVISGLKPGGYIAQEIKAPLNFLISENAQQQAWLKPDGTSIVEVTFANIPYGSIIVTKVDAITGKPLANARFKVTDGTGAATGNSNGEFITNENGEFLVENLKPNSYVITEIEAPPNYAIDTTPQTVNVGIDGKIYKVSFKNQPSGAVTIRKMDTNSKIPLEGAKFKVTTNSGSVVGNGNGIFTTDATGTIVIPNLPKGSYVFEEIKAPSGYILENQTKTLAVDYGKSYTLDFYNKPMASLVINKIDSKNKQPLTNAEFKISQKSGDVVGKYKTDGNGIIQLDELEPGWYTAVEIAAPSGYLLNDTPQDFEIKHSKMVTLTFENSPLSGLLVRKLSTGTLLPLEGAEFTVKTMDGALIGSYRTGADGTFSIAEINPGWYTVTETKAPDGFALGDNVQNVEIKHSKLVTLEFQNKALASLIIKKVDEVTGKPLAGANFTVSHQSGGLVGEFTTGVDGTVSIPNSTQGWYVISETKAPLGYTLDSTAKTVEVKAIMPTVVTFTNKPYSGIEIIKIDSVSKAPLMGATFIVERDNGEKIGTFKTDQAGKIIVSDLTEGTYIVSETIAPDGYILDEAPKPVIVKSGKLTITEFTNKPFAGLQIKKINSETRQPIEGVEFAISKMIGEKVGNFKTGKDGLIFVPGLETGWYSVTEVKAAEGYRIDSEPRNVEITWGKNTLVEVENSPSSSLLILKTDAKTGKPLPGVVFEVKRADGQRVTGYIGDKNQPNTENNSPNKTTAPNGDVAGFYTTDAQGRILINDITPGEYRIVESEALKGYELDTKVRAVTVIPGKQAVVKVANTQKAGLCILKIDSITKKPIYNVEFMVFSENGQVVGTYYSDNNGIVDFSGILEAGRYTIRETRPAVGYYADDVPKTVNFEAGKYTEIVWINIPQMGQIQITKKSGDANEVNGLPAGTPLEGAVFEVYAYKSGNLIDRFVSGNDGKAISSPLPTGRYLVKEVQAPKYYKLSDKQLDIEVEFATQIIKEEFLNYSANTGVYIKKTGNVEAMPGDTIRYDIKAVQNTSSVPLTDFYWRDTLPTDAVRLTKITTGTYNQGLKYKVIATTNKGNTIIVADNLQTTINNTIDCSNASLGLRNDEFVTSFTLVFGNVKAGFAQVQQSQIYMSVLKNLPNGYQFANKADVGGKYGSEWVISNSTWLTTIYAKPNKLPKTGY